MPLNVGILGSRISPEVQRVRRELRHRGAKPLLVELNGFPEVHRSSVGTEFIRAAKLDLGEAPVWLLRQHEASLKVSSQRTEAELDALRADIDDALLRDREVRSMLESMTWSLADVARVINHPERSQIHSRKPLLVALLARNGIPVPESVTTTSAETARAFIEAMNGQAICKAAAGGGEARLATEVVGPSTTADSTIGLSGPLLFQRRIVGASLRVYAVGEQVLSCHEIIHGDVVDWRTDQQGLSRHSLDSKLSDIVIKTINVTGLDYAGLDIELDHDGAPFVLDVNPAPLFASFEKVSGDDIAGPLAEYLINEARLS